MLEGHAGVTNSEFSAKAQYGDMALIDGVAVPKCVSASNVVPPLAGLVDMASQALQSVAAATGVENARLCTVCTRCAGSHDQT